MSARDFEGVFYVKRPPDIAFDDGVYHVGYDIGPKARVEIVMSCATFNKAMLLAEEARAVSSLPASANVTKIRKKP